MIDNLTVIVPYWNGGAALLRLLESLPAELPVIVVDDASDDPPPFQTRARVAQRGHRGYFSGAVNSGIRACDTDVLVLNQDVWLEGDRWLEVIAGSRDVYALIGDGVFGHPAWPQGYVQGTFMYMRRDAINAVGLLDERDWPLWGATCEWQLRACRRGFHALPLRHVPGLRHEERRGRFGAAITRALNEEPGKRDWFIRTPPLVSVVVPCFNYGRYLPDCVNSLIGGQTSLGEMAGQTFQGFEVIIVDDASTDDTEQIARKLADPWKGIRYIRHIENMGCPAAENTGVQAAYGRYIQIISADDMAAPEMLEKRLRVLEHNPRAMAYSDVQLFGNGKLLGVWKSQEYDFEQLIQRNHVPCGIMVPKQGLIDAGGFPTNFRWGREDWAVAVALGRVGYCGQRVPEPHYLYRREGQSRTLRNRGRDWMEFFRQQMRETFPDLYAGERPMGCCGKRTSNVTTTSAPARTASLQSAPMMASGLRPGEAGMTLVEYVGANLARTYWYGPVTGVKYTFSGRRRVGYVDNRDLPGMLEIMYDRAPAFKRYVPPDPLPTQEMVAAVKQAPEPAGSQDGYCEATTRSGNRCKLKALPGSRFCKRHQQ